jgi:hypothetical protein
MYYMVLSGEKYFAVYHVPDLSRKIERGEDCCAQVEIGSFSDVAWCSFNSSMKMQGVVLMSPCKS